MILGSSLIYMCESVSVCVCVCVHTPMCVHTTVLSAQNWKFQLDPPCYLVMLLTLQFLFGHPVLSKTSPNFQLVLWSVLCTIHPLFHFWKMTTICTLSRYLHAGKTCSVHLCKLLCILSRIIPIIPFWHWPFKYFRYKQPYLPIFVIQNLIYAMLDENTIF